MQRRTTVERERILTERIAEILMGCKDFTQRSQEKAEESNDAKEKIVIKSHLLKKLHKTVIIYNFLCSRNYTVQQKITFFGHKNENNRFPQFFGH